MRSFRTDAENALRLSRQKSCVPADNLGPNDVDCVMQSCPRREVKEERAAGPFGEFKLNTRVESVEMNANHTRCPATGAGGKRSLIERSEPAIGDGHLVVHSDGPWYRWPVLRGNETGGVCVNGTKVHDSSVSVAGCASAAHLLPRIGVVLCWVKDGVGFYALGRGGQAKRMTKRTARCRSRAKLAHSKRKFILSHRFSTGSARPIDIFSTALDGPRMARLSASERSTVGTGCGNRQRMMSSPADLSTADCRLPREEE